MFVTQLQILSKPMHKRVKLYIWRYLRGLVSDNNGNSWTACNIKIITVSAFFKIALIHFKLLNSGPTKRCPSHFVSFGNKLSRPS